MTNEQIKQCQEWSMGSRWPGPLTNRRSPNWVKVASDLLAFADDEEWRGDHERAVEARKLAALAAAMPTSKRPADGRKSAERR